MATLTKGVSYSAPGLPTHQADVTRSANQISIWGGADVPITLNSAHQMSDYAEGSANEITGNLTAGHGQTSGTYDFYWQESGVNKCRYGVSVTVSVNAISTTSGGSGDNFPTTPDAQPVLCKQKSVATEIDGDAVAILVAVLDFNNTAATGRGHIAFQETGGTAVGALSIGGVQNGVAAQDIDVTGGASISGILTGNLIGLSKVSHNDTAYTPTLELTVLQTA